MHVAERIADRADPLADPKLAESPNTATGNGPALSILSSATSIAGSTPATSA
jgi:hypothetical protein